MRIVRRMRRSIFLLLRDAWWFVSRSGPPRLALFRNMGRRPVTFCELVRLADFQVEWVSGVARARSADTWVEAVVLALRRLCARLEYDWVRMGEGRLFVPKQGDLAALLARGLGAMGAVGYLTWKGRV